MLATSAPSAQALSVAQSFERTISVAGTGCGRVARQISLPVRTRSASVTAPQVGDQLRDLDGAVVAEIIEARVVESVGRRAVVVTAQGIAATCPEAAPGAPPTAATAWEAELDITARVRRDVHVYFPQVCCDDRHDVRPRRLFLGASFFLDRVRWRSWGGSTARATARLPWNSCDPSCAEGQTTWIPARVVLSRPRLCNGVYQYLTVRYTMTRRPPQGSRSGPSYFGFRCV